MGCPPDTDSKRLARFYLFRRILMLWATVDKPEGTALVLAGPEASEIGCLRYYLSLPGEKVYFVDNKENAGLEIVKNIWSTANCVCGDIQTILEELKENIAFVNLDFCGYMTDKVLESVDAAARKLVTGGVIAYTFVRDRENALTPNWDLAQKQAKRIIAQDPRYRSIKEGTKDWLDAVRFLGYTEILKTRLGKDFEPIFKIRYSSDRAMGMVALQKMPVHQRTPAWRRELAKSYSFEERSGYIFDVELRSKLREIAMELTDKIPAKKVAEILHLPATTLAAWQAHKTRGTYNKQTEEEA
jgi:hypothetical protein